MFEATTKGASMGTPFTDILVPLDGSPAAERALIPALRLARRTGVPLRILSRALPDELDRFTDYLTSVATLHATEADIETLVVDRESIPDAIAKGVEPGTLVCLSSHGRGGLARTVMGSVAEALLRTLGQPALVVGPYVTEDAALAGRIVACVDGSAESERTLQPAKEWSAALGLPLWVVEVVEPGAPAEWARPGDSFDSGHVAALARGLGGVEGWDVLHDRHPADALVDMVASAAERTALLVMATHGRTGWGRLRLGSVTTATVHGSAVPVLVVPAVPGGGRHDGRARGLRRAVMV
jgi:nucleotide-binding universal stress UspA family protein